MRVIKMLGAALIGCAAFIGVSANAQTPVSCSWSVISSDGPPNGSWRNIVRVCKESNGALVATQSFLGTSTGGVQNCVLTPVASISYTGSCISPTFFRAAASSSSAQSSSSVSSVSACATPGMRVQGGCANSYNSSMLTNPTIVARCGSGCSLEYRTIGWTSACPSGYGGSSPEYGLFCK